MCKMKTTLYFHMQPKWPPKIKSILNSCLSKDEYIYYERLFGEAIIFIDMQ